jgi:tRNA A37 methylthiotransferase MiaB
MNTVRLVEELRFERVHLAQYTPRPRTVAAGLPQVPDPVKKQRSKQLMKVVERIGLEEHMRYVGTRAEALVVSRGERGGLDAKLYNYMPVVLPEGSATSGEWRCIEVTGATWYDLRGRVVEC